MGKESTAFVIGNGTSRLIFDLELLKQYGTTYGCNAIYRDFIPDQLFAVDGKMVKEFNAKRIQDLTEIWVNDQVPKDQTDGMHFIPKPLKKGTGCGFTALLKALYDEKKTIYMIGFDLHPECDVLGLQYFNNVYAGTENYKSKADQPPHSNRYIPKLLRILNDNKDVNFIRAYDSKMKFIPKEWEGRDNLEHVSNVQLKKIIERW